MKDFLKILKSKLESNDSFGKEAEEKFLSNFKQEFGETESGESIWSVFTFQHAVAACLLIVSTIALYTLQSPDVGNSGLAALQIMENEAVLANLEVLEELEELEEFEDLTDEDWEVLLGDAS